MKPPLVEGIDYYWHGHLVVLTEHYHLARGYCCGLGCAHCPYDYEAVPEPKRSELIEMKQPSKHNTKDAS